MLSRPEVLGEPALGVEARVFNLAVVVEQHNGGARRRGGGERADEPLASLRIPQRVLALFLKVANWTTIRPLLDQDGWALEAEQEAYQLQYDAPLAAT